MHTMTCKISLSIALLAAFGPALSDCNDEEYRKFLANIDCGQVLTELEQFVRSVESRVINSIPEVVSQRKDLIDLRKSLEGYEEAVGHCLVKCATSESPKLFSSIYADLTIGLVALNRWIESYSVDKKLGERARSSYRDLLETVETYMQSNESSPSGGKACAD